MNCIYLPTGQYIISAWRYFSQLIFLLIIFVGIAWQLGQQSSRNQIGHWSQSRVTTMAAEWQPSEMCLAYVNLPGSVVTLQKSFALEVCVMYLTIHYTAVLSFCRRDPTGKWNGAVPPASSTPAHDLYVIHLVSWIVSVGCVLDYDLLFGFPASWKLLALANTHVLLHQPLLWWCFLFSSAAHATLSLGFQWVCVFGQAGVLSVHR